MTTLTPYESTQLQKLAKKAGIEIDVPTVHKYKLKRRDISKIEEALGGSPKSKVVVILKDGYLTAVTLKGFRSWQNNATIARRSRNTEVSSVQSAS